MDQIENLLFKLGIPTYVQSIYVDIPPAAQQTIRLPKQLPTQIGWIYGLNTYLDTQTPDNNPLITFAEALQLYLVLRQGQTSFIQSLRLDTLTYTFAGGNDRRYLPVNVPYTISLDESYIQNPTAIVNGGVNKQIMINLWYIDMAGYNVLLKSGLLFANGMKSDGVNKK